MKWVCNCNTCMVETATAFIVHIYLYNYCIHKHSLRYSKNNSWRVMLHLSLLYFPSSDPRNVSPWRTYATVSEACATLRAAIILPVDHEPRYNKGFEFDRERVGNTYVPQYCQLPNNKQKAELFCYLAKWNKNTRTQFFYSWPGYRTPLGIPESHASVYLSLKMVTLASPGSQNSHGFDDLLYSHRS